MKISSDVLKTTAPVSRRDPSENSEHGRPDDALVGDQTTPFGRIPPRGTGSRFVNQIAAERRRTFGSKEAEIEVETTPRC